MSKPIGDRIQIDILINILEDLTYEEVTWKRLLDFDITSDVTEETILPYKEIRTDDYVFTIAPVEEHVAYSGGIRVNDSILLWKQVGVYLPYRDNEEDLYTEGKIIQNKSGRHSLVVTYEIL